jgi:hypothetical protein
MNSPVLICRGGAASTRRALGVLTINGDEDRRTSCERCRR